MGADFRNQSVITNPTTNKQTHSINMKKTLILAASLLGAIGAYAQGTVYYQDGQSDVTIHIFAPQAANSAVQLTGDQAGSTGVTADAYYNNGTDGNYAGTATSNTGNTSTASVGGSAVYTGGAIGNTAAGNATAAGAYNYNNGSDYTVELYAAPGLNAPVSALQPVTQYLTTIATSSTKGGQFKTVNVTGDTGIPNTSSGSATIALVAWYNGAGTYTSYSAALSAGVPTGMSPLDNDSILGNIGGPPASLTADMQGLESFSLVVPGVTPIPEPSTVALGVIGASTLLFRRRKK